MEKYTEAVREVLRRSEREARAWRFEYVGTEHVLLALMEQSSMALRVLESLQISPAVLRAEIRRVIERRCGRVADRKPLSDESQSLPRTPRVAEALECAARERESLQFPGDGVLQLLVALAGTNHGVAAECLTALGATVEKVRDSAMALAQDG